MWFINNLDIVFFIYGLAFVIMGLAVFFQPKDNSAFELSKIIWLIGLFGIVHGVNEWLDMWAIIKIKGKIFDIIRWFCLVFSFIFLFEFGQRTCFFKDKNWKYNKSYKYTFRQSILPLVVIGGIFIIGFLSKDFWQVGSILSRYLLGFVGSWLTGYGFYSYYKHDQSILNFLNVKKYFLYCSISFLIYGVLGGLIVPKGSFFPSTIINTDTFIEYVHLPVQLLRACLAVVISWNMVGILKIFDNETKKRLEKEIIARRESEKILEEKTTYLDNILHSSIDMIIAATDINFKIKYYNPLAEKLLGYKATDVIGKTVQEIRINEGFSKEKFEEAIKIISTKGLYKYTIEKDINGNKCTIFIRVSGIFNREKNIIGYILMGQDVTERVKMEKELSKLATTDTLTQAFNRARFSEIIDIEIERVHRYDNKLSIIMFDIDHFKNVNDTYGHIIGDKVLKKIAAVTMSNIRKIDSLFRWGGEEFIIVSPGTNIECAWNLAEKIRWVIENEYFHEAKRVTVSLGVAEYKLDECKEDLISRADEALYKAKSEGRNRAIPSIVK
ncbi:MAG: sensor domain-containing diguanylate cyclase [Candidatus Magnetoovum sp. WYHC-5]|nr:sensor domain-containing diguanylate cyclase [Candidatus Magnetoovum sp. WYHC-5]